jgi:hypothetical protein
MHSSIHFKVLDINILVIKATQAIQASVRDPSEEPDFAVICASQEPFMRLLFSLLLVLSASMLSAQTYTMPELPIDSNSNLVSYEGIVEMPKLDKDQLYNKAMDWSKEFFSSPSAFYTLRDPEKGKIEGKGRFNLWQDVKGQRTRSSKLIKYTLTLWFKDGKYRYRITKFNLSQASYFPIENWLEEDKAKQNEIKDYLSQVEAEAQRLLADLQDYMEKASAVVDEDDW